MNAGDIVQIRQVDTTDHWIYAKVLDPASRLVLVQHPGNLAHGTQLVMAAQDIRTKTDVLALLATATPMAAASLTNAQMATLGAADGWIKKFNQPELSQARNTLNLRLVQHYQTQVNQLS